MSAIPHPKDPAIGRAIPHVRPRARVIRRGCSATTIAMFAMRAMLALCILHGAAKFGGQLLIEEARRAAIRSESRAKTAEVAAAELRRQIDVLSSADAVSRWASLNGFEPSFLMARMDAH